nr:MAG TPA: hypothetical protein [Caudoviricetes sp.]
MKIEKVKATYSVECDICGHRIPEGTVCRMITDHRYSRVYFEHLRCPNGAPVVLISIPSLPLVSGALPFPSLVPSN